MNLKKVNMSVFVLFALFFSIFLTSSMGFSQTPIHTDPGGDNSPPCTDILRLWVDNDANFLRFKFELNGSFDQSVWPVYAISISIDNSTGNDMGWDLPIDYRIQFEIFGTGEIWSYFDDWNNPSNSHDDPYGAALEYYSLGDNNHTLEIGYKIKTADQGKGFLNVSIGDTIFLKFQAELDSDYAPDSDLLLRYVLTEGSGGIPGFELPLLSFAVLIVIMYHFLATKKPPI